MGTAPEVSNLIRPHCCWLLFVAVKLNFLSIWGQWKLAMNTTLTFYLIFWNANLWLFLYIQQLQTSIIINLEQCLASFHFGKSPKILWKNICKTCVGQDACITFHLCGVEYLHVLMYVCVSSPAGSQSRHAHSKRPTVRSGRSLRYFELQLRNYSHVLTGV